MAALAVTLVVGGMTRRWPQLRGRVLDTCAYPGGGHELREMGAIFADHMTGRQARIELMLAIGVHGGNLDAIRDVVEAGRYEN